MCASQDEVLAMKQMYFVRVSTVLCAALALVIFVGCSSKSVDVKATSSPVSEKCQGHTTPDQVRTASFVRYLDLSWGSHWKAGDVAFLGCLYDPSWHYVTPRGIIDKAHDIAASRRFAAANPHFKDTSRVLALNVFMNGSFAASSGLSEAHDGVADRWTDYFMWDGARWHAVFSQATPVNAKQS
jgi:hypothetical protein